MSEIDAESRYVPFTQQHYCCVPACIQMVMYRSGVPLVSQEELGYELGLTVPDEDVHLFSKVRTGERPPSGWGTQIYKEEFSLNAAFSRLNIPLHMELKLIDSISTAEELVEELRHIEADNKDALVCYRYGALFDTDSTNGHVCVFDRVDSKSGLVTLVDPEQNVPKQRRVPIDKLFQAMKVHGSDNYAGLWPINRLG